MFLDKFPILVKSNSNNSRVYLNPIELIILLLIYKNNKNYLLEFIEELKLYNLYFDNIQRLYYYVSNLQNNQLIDIEVELIRCKKFKFFLNKNIITSSLDNYELEIIVNFVKEHMFNKSFLLKHKYDSNKDLKLNYKQAIILHKIYNYKTIKQNELFHIIEELDIVKTDSSFRYYLRFLTVNNLIEISKIENGVRNSVIFSEDKCSYLIDNNFINSVIDVESFFLSYNKKEFKIRMKYNQDEFTINKSELLILSILKNHSYTNIIDIYKEAVKFKRIGISSIRKLVKKLISYNLITVLKKSNHKIITLSYAVDKNSLPNQLHYS